jgi:hypothetical protein
LLLNSVIHVWMFDVSSIIGWLHWLLNHRGVVQHFAVADSVWGQEGDESAWTNPTHCILIIVVRYNIGHRRSWKWWRPPIPTIHNSVYIRFRKCFMWDRAVAPLILANSKE